MAGHSRPKDGVASEIRGWWLCGLALKIVDERRTVSAAPPTKKLPRGAAVARGQFKMKRSGLVEDLTE
jgi:hypothetical protein